jgi:hypothetical protein
MLVRNLICSGILLGFILAVKSGLYALDAYGFWPYMALVLGCSVSSLPLP